MIRVLVFLLDKVLIAVEVLVSVVVLIGSGAIFERATWQTRFH